MAEQEVLNLLDWNLDKYVSFKTVLDLFRHLGVLFSTDKVLKSNGSEMLIQQININKVDKCCEMLTILIMQSDDSFFLKSN
jgi:hypothetical protein